MFMGRFGPLHDFDDLEYLIVESGRTVASWLDTGPDHGEFGMSGPGGTIVDARAGETISNFPLFEDAVVGGRADVPVAYSLHQPAPEAA